MDCDLANLSVFYEGVEHDDFTFVRYGNKLCFRNQKKNVGNLTDSLSHKTNKEDALTVLCSVVEHLGSG